MGRRWFILIVYSCIGGVVSFLIDPLLMPSVDKFVQRATQLPFSAAWFVGFILSCMVAAVLATMRTLRIRHLFNIWYPSWIWAVVAGGIFALALHWAANEVKTPIDLCRLCVTLSPAAAGIACYAVLLCFLERDKGASPKSKSAGPINARPGLEGLPDFGDLDSWSSEPEGPVNVVTDDRFGFKPIAERIARHLAQPNSTTGIALIGPYGSGKTSVLLGVETLIRPKVLATKQRCLVAWARSWGASAGMSTAELILDVALDAVTKYIDCLSVAGVPAAYCAALDRSGSSFLGAISTLWKDRPAADDSLSRINSLLEACNYRLVIFVEDLDRNEVMESRYIEAQALLDRLRRTSNISFIIAISDQSKRSIDFGKICDRVEYLPELSSRRVLDLLAAFSKSRLAEHPDEVSWYFDNEGNPISQNNLDDLVIPAELGSLLETPRQLRFALRRASLAWRNLHGEIDLLELLKVCALYASVPEAFQFLVKNLRELRGNFLRDDKEQTEWLDKQWAEAVPYPSSPKSIAAKEAVLSLISTDVPQARRNPQSIRIGRIAGIEFPVDDSVDYGQRMFAEEVVGLRDQEVAKGILRLKEDLETPDVLQELSSSKEWSGRFERLVSASEHEAHPLHLDNEVLYHLAGNFHRYILVSQRVAAAINDEITPAAYFCVWRLIKSRHSDELIGWVKEEISVALKGSLRLAIDISHWWINTTDDVVLQKEIRRHLVAQVRGHVESAPGLWLKTVLNPGFPSALYDLIRYPFHDRDPVFGPHEWQWILDELISLCESAPEFVPTVASVVSKTQSRWDLSEEHPKQIFRWTLDQGFLKSFIQDSEGRTSFLKCLVNSPICFPDHDCESLSKGLLQDIRNYLQSTDEQAK